MMKHHFFSQVRLDIIGQWLHLLSSGQKVKLIAAGNSWPSWPSWQRRWRRPVLSLAARHVKRLSQWARSRWTRKRRTTTRKPRDVYIFGASGEQKKGSLWSGRKRCGKSCCGAAAVGVWCCGKWCKIWPAFHRGIMDLAQLKRYEASPQAQFKELKERIKRWIVIPDFRKGWKICCCHCKLHWEF